jgi:hypothetical protein
MSISAVSNPTISQPPPPAAPQSAPAKDNDGDFDHGAPDVKAATPPGAGVNLDIKA